jgi:hypothetical protein
VAANRGATASLWPPYGLAVVGQTPKVRCPVKIFPKADNQKLRSLGIKVDDVL